MTKTTPPISEFTVEFLPSILASLIIGLLAAVLTMRFSGIVTFPELIASHAALKAIGKTGDILVAPIFALTFSLSFLSLLKLSKGISNLNYHLVTPAVIGLTGIVRPLAFNDWSTALDHQIFIIIAFTSLWIILTSFEALIRIKKHENDLILTEPLVAISFLLSILPLGIELLLTRFSVPHNLLWIRWLANNYLSTLFILMSLSFASLFLFTNRKFKEAILLIAQISQIHLPLFLFTLIPTYVVSTSGEEFHYSCFTLKLLVTGTVLGGILYQSRYALIRYRYLRLSSNEAFLKRNTPILSLFSIYLIAHAALTSSIAFPNIYVDDYHFGEQILGSWLYQNGKLPYVDYIPAHGLLADDLITTFNFLFFNGDVATFAFAANIVKTVALFALFFISFKIFQNRIFAFFTATILNTLTIVSWPSLVPISIGLLLLPYFSTKHCHWLILWAWLFFFLIPGLPGQGLIILLSSLPLAIFHFVCLFRKARFRDFVPLGFGIALAGLAIVLININIWIGAIDYVITQSRINQAAYSLPWSGGTSSFFGSLGFEVIRNSWILVLTLYLLTVIHDLGKLFKTPQKEDILKLCQLLLCLGFLILIAPYAMGRIDADNFSRPGGVTSISLLFFLPFLFSKESLLKSKYQYQLMIPALLVSHLLLGNLHFTEVNQAINVPIKVQQSSIVNFEKLGFKGLGVGLVDQGYAQMLVNLKKLVESNVKEDETFIDLNNRHAWYRYLNKLPPIFVTANYNMSSHKQQLEGIRQLENNPKVAMAIFHFFPQWFDGVSFTYRAPLLFKYLFDNFKIIKDENNIIYGIRRKIEDDGSQDNFDLWDNVVFPNELSEMPLSWGFSKTDITQNYQKIEKIVTKPTLHNLKIGAKSYIRQIDSLSVLEYEVAISPEVAFLTFDFECKSPYENVGMRLSWEKKDLQGTLTFGTSLESLKRAIRYPLSRNLEHTLLIPTLIFPRWFTKGTINNLKISLIGCQEFTIKDILIFS